MPTDRARIGAAFRGLRNVELSSLVERASGVQPDEGATLFMTLLAAFQC